MLFVAPYLSYAEAIGKQLKKWFLIISQVNLRLSIIGFSTLNQ